MVARSMPGNGSSEALQRIKIIRTAPASSGKTNLLKYMKGDVLTQRQVILAKCCECMGYYIDGRECCGIQTCPLYPFMPYKNRKGVESNGTVD